MMHLAEADGIVAYGRLHLWKTTVPGMAKYDADPSAGSQNSQDRTIEYGVGTDG